MSERVGEELARRDAYEFAKPYNRSGPIARANQLVGGGASNAEDSCSCHDVDHGGQALCALNGQSVGCAGHRRPPDASTQPWYRRRAPLVWPSLSTPSSWAGPSESRSACANRLDAVRWSPPHEGRDRVGSALMPRQGWFQPGALRRARLNAGMTQSELARRLGVAGGERVSRWELGLSVPRSNTVVRAAEVLGVEVGDLRGNNGAQPEPTRRHSCSPPVGRFQGRPVFVFM